MANISLSQISNVRIGKHITLEVEAGSEEEAKSMVDSACRKLLANLIMESFEFTISKA